MNGGILTKRLAARTLALLGLLILAQPSYAFRMIQANATGRVTGGSRVTCNDSGGFAHWTTSNTTWRHNTAGQGNGKAGALQAAMQSWTAVSGASHVLTYGGTTSAGWSTDGTNTILWANGNGCFGNCLALTALVMQSGQRIVESDITFNANFNWRTDGGDQDTQAVATHELGHALGIHHTQISSNPQPTMAATYFGSGGRTLENDDRAALQCSESRYGTPPPLGTPTPSGPNGTTTDTTPTYSWSSVPNAVYYRLSAQTQSGTYYYLPEPLPSGTSFTPSLPLQAGQCYNWWVRAERAIGDSGPWSSMQTVCVTGSPLGTPTTISPTGTTADRTPTYTWSSVPNAVYYRLSVQTQSGTYYYLPEPLPSGTSFTPILPLQAGQCYNWWVRAERAIGDSGPWSSMKTICVSGGGFGKEEIGL